MKTHGDPGWESYPSYIDIFVPRILEFLEKRNLKITFFIVGQDAALEYNRESLAMISAAGHEIGNHSFKHEPWLHLYSKEQLTEEFRLAEAALEETFGHLPTGFRGPGYSLSKTVLEVLAERGYNYDCSTLPTFIAPLARAYYFFKSPEMSDEEKEKRKKLFGKFSDGFQTLKPYEWKIGEKRITEIPVTTLPVFKTPIHASYVIYLSTFSKFAARQYWSMALKMCRSSGVQPSLLLHPLDFLSGDDAKELEFFPGMAMNVDEKIKFVDELLERYADEFDVVNMSEHARHARESGLMKLRDSSECG
jgi:hypothetical protein